MKITLKIKRAILRKALNILGVCTIGLIAACAKYGVEVSTFNINLSGTVKSKDSSNTIKNIQVEVENSFSQSTTLTDDEGNFSVNVEIPEGNNFADLKISDIDGSLNGSYVVKDTILNLSTQEMQSGNKSGIKIQLEKGE